MTDGVCDVEKCQRETYMGWRPLTTAEGRQVCKYHWSKHKNSTSNFNLFDAFGFERPVRESEAQPEVKLAKQPELCICGEKPLPGHRFCKKCAAKRERERKREYYHRKRDDELLCRLGVSDFEENIPRCKDCGDERLPGYSYCQKCGQYRRQKSNCERQRRYKKSIVCRMVNRNGFGLQKSPFLGSKTRKKFSEFE